MVSEIWVCDSCDGDDPSAQSKIQVPGGVIGPVWCPWCAERMSEFNMENHGKNGLVKNYSVGPLDHETWLVLHEMVSRAYDQNENDGLHDEYQDARKSFIQAYPKESYRDPSEYWSEQMKEAWNKTMANEINRD